MSKLKQFVKEQAPDHIGHRIEASLGMVVCHDCKTAIGFGSVIWYRETVGRDD